MRRVNVSNSRDTSASSSMSKEIEMYYERLKTICEGEDEKKKIQIAEKMARRINEYAMLYLLNKLATDTYPCKMQAILIISRTSNPNEEVLKILGDLLNDSDYYYIRIEASKILTKFAEMGNPTLDKLAQKLFEGGHKLKIHALRIYEQMWRFSHEQAIQDLGDAALKESDYIIFKGIINLLGEIGSEYPKEIAEIFSKLLSVLKSDEKKIILEAITKFAREHPNEALQLLTQIERSDDVSTKFIPKVLPLTVNILPKESFELLKNMAKSNNKSVRFSVMQSLQHFEKIYPEATLEVLFELWQNTSDEEPGYRGEECVTQKEIRSRFVKIGMDKPAKALSFLTILSVCKDVTRRRNALEATSELAPKAPDNALSLLEAFSHDSDYEIKIGAVSSFSEEWNIFPEKTIPILKILISEEIKKLREEIEKVFALIKGKNLNEAKIVLKKLESGNSKIIFDAISRTVSHLHIDKQKIPQELFPNGLLKIQEETILCFEQNNLENYEKGLEFIKELSSDYAIWMRIIALRTLPRFLPTNLNAVLEILEGLAKNEVSQVRVEALEYIITLMKTYPDESFKIIKKICNNHNKSVRIDIVRRLYHLKEDFLSESFFLLKKYTEDTDPEVRAQAAASIHEYMDSYPQEGLEIISRLCVDENDSVSRVAFDFLETLMEKNNEDVLSLLENLYNNKNPTIREKTASFVGNFKKEHSERVIIILDELARDPIGSVRFSAFSSFDMIGKYQPERALEILTTLAFEKNPEIRGRVVRSFGVLSQSYPPVDVEVLEQFLQDDDISVKIEITLTLGKMGRKNPEKATEIFRKILLLGKDELMKEAIAEAMADYGEYCPYEAMKILTYLSKSYNENISRKVENSFYTLKKRMEKFSYILQNCFRESFFTLREEELSRLVEIVLRRMVRDEEDLYTEELVHRYNLYHDLLMFSTISRINTSENLLAQHTNNLHLIDKSIMKALLALKDIAGLLGKQNFYTRRDDRIENLKDCLTLIEKTERQFEREFKEFDNPDYFILQSVLRGWQRIISVEFMKLRGKAELKAILESKRAMKREKTTVRVKLVNEGISKAENITVSILSSDDFTIIGSPDRHLKILSPNDSAKIEFYIKVKNGSSPMRTSFTMTFDDAEKGGKVLNFADQIAFSEYCREYREMENPYIPGIPLRTPRMFYGRNKFLKNIETTLKMGDRNHILILHGQRRTGKTSLLYQLKIRLEDDFLPIILDFQGIPDSGTDIFFYWITREIWKELSKRNIEIAMPDESKFAQKPAFFFRDIFLQEALEKLGACKMIFLIDEFEAIDDKICEKKLDKDILTFLRNLMQHSDKINFIFSGTHQLEEMSSDYWSILFNIGLYYRISFLERNEAIQLICDPLKEYIEYDPLAVEKILEMTAGHPYFVQLICYHLVEYQMTKRRSYVTIEDVNEVLDKVAITGTPHLEYIWEGMDRLERIVLLTLANVLFSQSVSAVSDIVKYLQQYFFEIGEQKVREILDKLLKDDIIEQKMADHYCFKVELIKYWCEKNKELYKLMEGI